MRLFSRLALRKNTLAEIINLLPIRCYAKTDCLQGLQCGRVWGDNVLPPCLVRGFL